jgi:hypothetical protein
MSINTKALIRSTPRQQRNNPPKGEVTNSQKFGFSDVYEQHENVEGSNIKVYEEALEQLGLVKKIQVFKDLQRQINPDFEVELNIPKSITELKKFNDDLDSTIIMLQNRRNRGGSKTRRHKRRKSKTHRRRKAAI